VTLWKNILVLVKEYGHVKSWDSLTPKGKIFVIALNASNLAFLARHFFNEDGEELVEILQLRNLTRWWKSYNLLFSQHWNFIASFKHNASTKGAMGISYFFSNQRVFMITSNITLFLEKWLGKRRFCLKCRSMG